MKKPIESFGDYVKSAEKKASAGNGLESVVNEAFSKAMDLDDSSSRLSTLISKIVLFTMMLKAYIRGEYTNVPWRTIVSVTASLLYFINPFDIVPDFVPVLGLLDDLAVVLWVANNIEKDLADFQVYRVNEKKN